jgi:hypothetical protein
MYLVWQYAQNVQVSKDSAHNLSACEISIGRLPVLFVEVTGPQLPASKAVVVSPTFLESLESQIVLANW